MSVAARVLSALLCLIAWTAPASAAESCHKDALRQLERLAPEGHAIYRRAGNKEDFLRWVTCEDIQLGLSTAVHETVHMLSIESNSYLLIDGTKLPRVAEGKQFFAPGKLSSLFDRESTFVTTYLLPGAASSADFLSFLLDELNAYTHDLNTAVKLQAIARSDRDVYHRDGLSALMAFVAAYADKAWTSYPETWTALAKPATRDVVVRLWVQAEGVMANSCRNRRIGFEASEYLAHVCAETAKHGLGKLLGRPPVCPISCLNDRLSQRTGD